MTTPQQQPMPNNRIRKPIQPSLLDETGMSLPVNGHVVEEVIQLLGDDRCDSATLESWIKQDPMLCLLLFHQADILSQQRKGEVQHLAHAIGLLGRENIEQTLSACQHHCSDHHDRHQQQGLQEALAASVLAAHLSSALLINKHHVSGSRFFMLSLLFNAPLWLAWLTAPDQLSRLKRRVHQQAHPYCPLYRQLSAFEVPHLLQTLQRRLRLPEITNNALAINPKENLSLWATIHHCSAATLTRWLNQHKVERNFFYRMETGIYLFNQYSLAVYLDRQGKHIQRFTRLLGGYLNMETEKVTAEIMTIASDIDASHYPEKTLAPANRIHALYRVNR